jgi:hypothetical protein
MVPLSPFARRPWLAHAAVRCNPTHGTVPRLSVQCVQLVQPAHLDLKLFPADQVRVVILVNAIIPLVLDMLVAPSDLGYTVGVGCGTTSAREHWRP